jgi:zeaxanthin glucosyltransferase
VAALPGSPLVVAYAPQTQLLAKAKLTITHGGLNTVLDSLSNGVPLVVMPIAFEQPGIAARTQWAGCGEVLPAAQTTVPELRAAIKRVITDSSYSRHALHLQESIRKAGGVVRAADIVEQVVATGKPVLASCRPN